MITLNIINIINKPIVINVLTPDLFKYVTSREFKTDLDVLPTLLNILFIN